MITAPRTSNVRPARYLPTAWLGQPGFDLVFSPLLLAMMAISSPVAAIVTFERGSNWFEGVLCVLYIAIATAF
ncbi:Ca2+/H+ antiporter [Mycobacteroides chelonae]|nr:Ca2+/H+ antiporter [Mycobacteroides chelonae]